MKVATIESDNNVAVPQTSVVCFKAAHILKLALGHAAGTSEQTDCGEKGPTFCNKSACFSDQHWVSEKTNKKNSKHIKSHNKAKTTSMWNKFQIKKNNKANTSKVQHHVQPRVVSSDPWMSSVSKLAYP